LIPPRFAIRFLFQTTTNFDCSEGWPIAWLRLVGVRGSLNSLPGVVHLSTTLFFGPVLGLIFVLETVLLFFLSRQNYFLKCLLLNFSVK